MDRRGNGVVLDSHTGASLGKAALGLQLGTACCPVSPTVLAIQLAESAQAPMVLIDILSLSVLDVIDQNPLILPLLEPIHGRSSLISICQRRALCLCMVL